MYRKTLCSSGWHSVGILLCTVPVAPVGRPVLVYDNMCAVFSLFICVVSTVYAVCVIVYYNLFD